MGPDLPPLPLLLAEGAVISDLPPLEESAMDIVNIDRLILELTAVGSDICSIWSIKESINLLFELFENNMLFELLAVGIAVEPVTVVPFDDLFIFFALFDDGLHSQSSGVVVDDVVEPDTVALVVVVVVASVVVVVASVGIFGGSYINVGLGLSSSPCRGGSSIVGFIVLSLSLLLLVGSSDVSLSSVGSLVGLLDNVGCSLFIFVGAELSSPSCLTGLPLGLETVVGGGFRIGLEVGRLLSVGWLVSSLDSVGMDV